MNAHTHHHQKSWERQTEAQQAYASTIETMLEGCHEARKFASALLDNAGIRLADIVDHLVIADEAILKRLEANGWLADGEVLRNATGLFPPALHGEGNAVMIRVEEIETFAKVKGIAGHIAGAPFAPLRMAIAFEGPVCALGVVERNGGTAYDVAPDDPAETRKARLHLQAFRSRRREFDTPELGLDAVEQLVDAAVGEIGAHRACALWLMAEREYWQRRCAAGRLQKKRQDAVGVGWANIDHHTYDSSRRHFRQTVRILEKLGYQRREMLYAGELAGWGSQVLEQPVIGSTIFADVDLSPEELTIDFAREDLPELPRHRRAGLLSALLGESMLEAGLNHVAGLFDQQNLRTQLGGHGIRMMAPFSAFPHLYQELTEGDWGAVDPARVDRLERQGHISPDEAEKLRLEGSIVTHLENIERNDGYKGFNREGIDSVLRKLDPRAYHGEAAS